MKQGDFQMEQGDLQMKQGDLQIKQGGLQMETNLYHVGLQMGAERQRLDIRMGDEQVEQLDLQIGSELQWIDLRMVNGQEHQMGDQLHHIDFPMGIEQRQVQLHIPVKYSPYNKSE